MEQSITKPAPGREADFRGTININCLRILRLPTRPYYHYDVFDDPKIGYAGRTRIIDELQQKNRDIFKELAGYDGRSNLFSPDLLNFGGQKSHDFDVPRSAARQDSPIRVKIEYAQTINPSDLQDWSHFSQGSASVQNQMPITLLNVLLRMYPRIDAHLALKGRGFFSETTKRDSGGVELWQGFITSIRPATPQFVINIDASICPMFPSCKVLDALLGFLRISNPRALDSAIRNHGTVGKRCRNQIRSYLKNLSVLIQVKGRQIRKTIKKVNFTSPEEHDFHLSDGTETNVAEYFHRRYNKRLDFPKMSLLAMFSETNHYPIELLTIAPGQPFRGTLPPNAASDALRFATKIPKDKLLELKSSIKLLGVASRDPQGTPTSSYLHTAGMAIEDQFMKVDARVLAPPTLATGQGPLHLRKGKDAGVWNMMRNKVAMPATIRTVICINAAQTGPEQTNVLLRKIREMLDVFAQMGIRVAPNLNQDGDDVSSLAALEGSLEKMRKLLQENKCRQSETLVVVIVNDDAKPEREYIKWWGDVYTGCPTQVLKASKVLPDRGFDQYARNVALKVNAKMNGVNVTSHTLDERLTRDNVMIVGLDTSHPPPKSNSPTTAAMVYSVQSPGGQAGVDYRSRVKFQEPRQEVIEGLSDWILDALKQHSPKDPNNPSSSKYCRRVVVYRDGVSEGQFAEIVDKELSQIQEALSHWQRLTGLSKPVFLTFIVVGKKHHIRFFPENGDYTMADNKGNSVPGTVVDTAITYPHPKFWDFYMQSHAALLGTSRPAHYSVLYDNSGLTADQVQKFSYELCHLYQIATRSTSIPAPVYYADRIAARYSIFFNHVFKLEDNASADSEEPTFAHWSQYFERPYVKPHLHSQSRMYWL